MGCRGILRVCMGLNEESYLVKLIVKLNDFRELRSCSFNSIRSHWISLKKLGKNRNSNDEAVCKAEEALIQDLEKIRKVSDVKTHSLHDTTNNYFKAKESYETLYKKYNEFLFF